MRSPLEEENRESLSVDTSALAWMLQLLGVRPITFELLAEIPLNQCLERFKLQEEYLSPIQWLSGRCQVASDVWLIDAKTYGFHMQKRQRGRADVDITGSIASLSEAACHVRGQATSSNWLYLPTFVMAFLTVLIALSQPYGNYTVFAGGTIVVFLCSGAVLTSLFSYFDKLRSVQRLTLGLR